MKYTLRLIVTILLTVLGLLLVYFFIRQPILTTLLDAKDRALSDVQTSQEIVKVLGGESRSTTTLFVFANHAEQRVGGGFVGSVGLIKGENGKLSVDSIRSIYYYDHRLEGKGIFVSPPNYLAKLVPAISARDSLLSEKPTENVQMFRDLFARESGVYADNVVIVTPKALEVLLEYTGPIELPEYHLTIDSNNILTSLQTEIEAGIDKQSGKDPKAILGVLATGIIAKLPELKPAQFTDLNRDILKLMSNKQAYIYSKDSVLMARLAKWQSSLAQPGSENSLLVSAANHNATKSSQAIHQRTDAIITIHDDGSAQMQLTITRQHTQDYSGKYTDPKSGQQQWLIGDDQSWVQATLPQGAELVNADGLTTVSTNPFTVGRDVLTKPLSTTQVEIVLKLPQRFQLTDELRVRQLLLAQFGWFGQDYSVTVTPPLDYTPIVTTGEKLADGHSIRYTGFQINDIQLDYVFRRTQ